MSWMREKPSFPLSSFHSLNIMWIGIGGKLPLERSLEWKYLKRIPFCFPFLYQQLHNSLLLILSPSFPFFSYILSSFLHSPILSLEVKVNMSMKRWLGKWKGDFIHSFDWNNINFLPFFPFILLCIFIRILFSSSFSSLLPQNTNIFTSLDSNPFDHCSNRLRVTRFLLPIQKNRERRERSAFPFLFLKLQSIVAGDTWKFLYKRMGTKMFGLSNSRKNGSAEV